MESVVCFMQQQNVSTAAVIKQTSSYTANPLALSRCPQGDCEVNAAPTMLQS